MYSPWGLRELHTVPLPEEEQGHLAAVCAAIETGAAQAWIDESGFVGPIPDAETQDDLWERHNHLRDPTRLGKVTNGPSVAATRASLCVAIRSVGVRHGRRLRAGPDPRRGHSQRAEASPWCGGPKTSVGTRKPDPERWDGRARDERFGRSSTTTAR